MVNFGLTPNKKKRRKEFYENRNDEMENHKLPYCYYILPFLASLLIYSNTFDASFVYDDSAAIVNNPDVTGVNPIWEVFRNDFWGNPLTNDGSHKSYRPLITLSFRLNHFLHGLKPFWYHVTNVLLHAITSTLFVFVAKSQLSKNALLFSSLLFAVHPIHTEAVSGLVGRADLVSALLSLVGILAYQKFEAAAAPLKAVCITILSMLCKETGVALLLILVVQTILYSKQEIRQKRSKCLKLILGFISLCIFRLAICNFKTPTFSSADNPIAHESNFWVRTMTLLYLPFLHFRIMTFPNTLNFDWSMDTVPLVISPFDSRFLISIIFYISLITIILLSSKNLPQIWDFLNPKYAESRSSTPDSRIARTPSPTLQTQNEESKSASILFALSILCFPHLLACNLLSYVGFVVAERILYLPSVGFCILFGLFFEVLQRRISNKTITLSLAIIILSLHSAKTYSRNFDWNNEEALYKSAIDTNPAKAYANLGHVYALSDRKKEAEEAYRKALARRPSMADTWYNLGILLKENGQLHESKRAYETAISQRNTFAAAYVNLALLNWDLGNKTEAERLFNVCAQLETTYVKFFIAHKSTRANCMYNKGRLLVSDGRHREALEAYQQALILAPPTYGNFAPLYNTMGESYMKLGEDEKAEFYFDKALSVSPFHVNAYLTKAHLKIKQNQTQLANDWFSRALVQSNGSAIVYYHMGAAMNMKGNLQEAEENYRLALEKDENHTDSLQALCNLLRESKRTNESEKIAKKLAIIRPNFESFANFGAILHLNQKYEEAEIYYQKALKIRPTDETTLKNLEKLHKAKAANNKSNI